MGGAGEEDCDDGALAEIDRGREDFGSLVGAGVDLGAAGVDVPILRVMEGGGGGASDWGGRSIGAFGGCWEGCWICGSTNARPGTNSNAPALSLLIV